jgi:hypothetical protein
MTYLPTYLSTYLPTDPPTYRSTTQLPTNQPTNLPTYLPTDRPTYLPTDPPTYRPTQVWGYLFLFLFIVVRCTPEAGARTGGEKLPLWSAALMRRDFFLSRVNADGKQTGETNTDGETPMRFFFSPWEFRPRILILPGRTICPARFRRSIKMWNCPTVRTVPPVHSNAEPSSDGQTHCCNYI